MPELPEVETTRRGLLPDLAGRRIDGLVVRQRRLRYPVPRNLSGLIAGQTLQDIDRRGKYLLFRFARGTLIVHLGMSGSLRLVGAAESGRPRPVPCDVRLRHPEQHKVGIQAGSEDAGGRECVLGERGAVERRHYADGRGVFPAPVAVVGDEHDGNGCMPHHVLGDAPEQEPAQAAAPRLWMVMVSYRTLSQISESPDVRSVA